jgi:hypothetical protein
MSHDKNVSLYESLLEFVRKESGTYEIIDRDTGIEKGLGITGQDAEDFIMKFAKKYNVDISNFMFSEYFNDEPTAFTFGHDVKKLTFGHLEKAAKVGKLDNGVIK